MIVYLVEHSNSEYSGFLGGVDFWRGRGSTSSKADALRLQGLGHKVDGLGIQQTIAAEGVVDTTPSAILSPETAALKAAEDNPDSEWSKRRAAQADAKKKRGGRRRKQ